MYYYIQSEWVYYSNKIESDSLNNVHMINDLPTKRI